MEKQFTNKINIAAGSIILEDILRSRLTDAVSGMSKMHPMMKIYFDSELNSDIERQTLLTITDAILKTTGFFAESNEKVKNIHEKSIIILDYVCDILFVVKLAHHANTGRITTEEMCQRLAEHITVKYVAQIIQIGNKIGEHLPTLLSKGLKDILITLNTNDKKAEKIANQVQALSNMALSWVKDNVTEDKVQEILTTAFKFTIEAIGKVMELTNDPVKIGIDYYKGLVEDIRAKAIKVFETFGWEVPELLKEKDDVQTPVNIEEQELEVDELEEEDEKEREDELEREDEKEEEDELEEEEVTTKQVTIVENRNQDVIINE